MPGDEVYLALFQGSRRVAEDCDGQALRRERAPLGSRPDPATLKRWLRRWTKVRHREAAERTLLTMIDAGLAPAALAEALLEAETERAFADGGHSLDFINKAFECLDLIGWQYASFVLPTIVGQIAARGARNRRNGASRKISSPYATKPPANIQDCSTRTVRRRMVGPCGACRRPARRQSQGDRRCDQQPFCRGAVPIDLGRSLAYAAALRVARFGNANEHGDWETAHHVFTHANALHRMLERSGLRSGWPRAAVRGVLHGAMALYLTRYLNVPPARIPGDNGEPLDDLPTEQEMICQSLLDAFDRQRQVDLAARLAARHLTLGHSPQALIATLARATLREDAGFHAYQMLEAGVRQFGVWDPTHEGRRILIAVARYLAAHSPTERAALQTADIARRLMRGGELHQNAEGS